MTTASDSTPWKRLHPLSVAVNLLPRTWRLVRQLWWLFLAMIYGNRLEGEAMFNAGIVGIFLTLTVGSTILHWATLRYRMHEGRLEIRHGLFNRQARVFSPDRIQNVELVRNVFHRATNLVEVRIETAGGTEIEGLLSALTQEEAEALMTTLGRARAPSADEGEAHALPVVIENGPADLARYGITATRIGTGLVLVGVALEGLQRADPTGWLARFGALGPLGIAAILVAGITGTWILGTVAPMVRHHGFRLLRRDDGLLAEEGLFTRRRVELPVGKVQVVTISEPWLRRLLGFGSVHIETAAARQGQGGTETVQALVPVVEQERMQEVVRAAIPHLDMDLMRAPLNPPHPSALVRSVLQASMRGSVLSAVLSWWFWPWGLISLLILPVSIIAAVLDHRHQGWLLTDRVLVARQGYLSRRTRVLARSKLQSLSVSQGPLLRRYGLGQLVVRVAGDAVAVPLLAHEEATRLGIELVEGLHPAEPPHPDAPTA